jgi:glycosyltransferase involved in cell wall biosynthesis
VNVAERPLAIHSPSSISVVTLCRNNPKQLQATLTAMTPAAEELCVALEILVMDGSYGNDCEEYCRNFSHALGPLRYQRLKPEGIYPAMNTALSLANGELVAFMHAGDRYLPGGLTALVDHWLSLSQNIGCRPAAVFGQAWVQPNHGLHPYVAPWLTPPSYVQLLRWLRRMVPCHQAFLFDITFARDHLYGSDSLVADRPVMREAIFQVGPACYLPRPVCVFALDGVSSQLPDTKEFIRRSQDRQRTASEKMAEIVKWLLRSGGLASQQARLMRLHALAWGWCCRLPGSR